MTRGFVYVIRFHDYYKIGRTQRSVEQRIAALQLPGPAEIVHSWETELASALERALHHLFAEKRKRGEWFALDESDVEKLKSLDPEDVIDGPEPEQGVLLPINVSLEGLRGGAALRAYRKAHRLSSRELARHLGMSGSMLRHLETGVRQISAERAIGIERATDGELMRGDLCPQFFSGMPEFSSESRA